jgi:hypothetical protein
LQSSVVTAEILTHIDSLIERISQMFVEQWTRFEQRQQSAFNSLLRDISCALQRYSQHPQSSDHPQSSQSCSNGAGTSLHSRVHKRNSNRV